SQTVQSSGKTATSAIVARAGVMNQNARRASPCSSPPERSARVTGPPHSEPAPLEDRLHFSRGSVERLGRLLLAGKGPVQVDLQQARELAVHRRHGPGRCVLDYRDRVRGKKHHAAGECRIAELPQPRGELTHGSTSLEHLLR